MSLTQFTTKLNRVQVLEHFNNSGRKQILADILEAKYWSGKNGDGVR
jgi:hypothetical protein